MPTISSSMVCMAPCLVLVRISTTSPGSAPRSLASHWPIRISAWSWARYLPPSTIDSSSRNTCRSVLGSMAISLAGREPSPKKSSPPNTILWVCFTFPSSSRFITPAGSSIACFTRRLSIFSQYSLFMILADPVSYQIRFRSESFSIPRRKASIQIKMAMPKAIAAAVIIVLRLCRERFFQARSRMNLIFFASSRLP